MRIARIRLSDKTACFRPRKVAYANDHGETAVCAPSSRSHGTFRNHSRRPLPASGVPRSKFESFLRFHMVCISQRLKIPEFRRVTPISSPSSLPAFALNQGSFPPPALPGFSGTTSPSATPSRPACPSRASGWSCARPRDGVSRVACAFLVCMLSPLPRRSDWASCFAHPSQSNQPSPIGCSGRPAHRPFRGLLSVHITLRPAHSRCHRFVTRFTRRLQPLRCLHDCSGCLPAGAFRRVGLSPTGKRRLFTAHTPSGQLCRSVADIRGLTRLPSSHVTESSLAILCQALWRFSC